MSKKAVILDRDGVINKDCDYTYRLEDLEILPGVTSGLKKFQEAGYLIIVITNQSGIGRGYFSQGDFEKFNTELLNQLKDQGVKIDSLYFCPHHPDDNCSCRKPKNGLLFKAQKDFDLDLSQCLVVGDSDRDFFNQVGRCKIAWIKNERYPKTVITDYTVDNLEELANLIIK